MLDDFSRHAGGFLASQFTRTISHAHTQDNMRAILTTAILAILTINANARIGETLEQAINRYGEPVKKEANKAAVFQKNVFTVATFFLPNGKIGGMMFEKKDTSGIIATNEKLTDDEIKRLLLINTATNNADWQEMPNTKLFKKYYATSDRMTIASYDTLTNKLMISTKEMVEFMDKERTQENQQQLKGF